MEFIPGEGELMEPDPRIKDLSRILAESTAEAEELVRECVAYGPRAVPYLLEVLETSKGTGVCRALGEIGDVKAVEPLLRVLTRDRCLSPGRGVLARLREVFGGRKTSRAVALGPAAANALGRIRKMSGNQRQHAHAVFLQVMKAKDTDPTVKTAVAIAVGLLAEEDRGPQSPTSGG
jgi:HEAT repeat protein